MKAEIISIGSEILRGQITDTNANFIAKKLVELDINLEHISAVSDNPESIPDSTNFLAIKFALVSVICPLSISLPILIISAFIKKIPLSLIYVFIL